MPINKICAAILAGGKSSRFLSGDKALAKWNTKTIIETEIDILKKLFEHVFIIANHVEIYNHFGIDVFPDIYLSKGPLGGIHSALIHATSDRVFIVGCDMPLLDEHFISWMANMNSWAPIIIPALSKGLEPLHAIYHVSLVPIIETIISSPQKTMGLQALIHTLPFKAIKEDVIKQFCPNLLCLRSINTIDELKKLKKLLKVK